MQKSNANKSIGIEHEKLRIVGALVASRMACAKRTPWAPIALKLVEGLRVLKASSLRAVLCVLPALGTGNGVHLKMRGSASYALPTIGRGRGLRKSVSLPEMSESVGVRESLSSLLAEWHVTRIARF